MTLLTSNNIAQSGLRTLFILQLLIKGPISKSQIMCKIATNPYLKDVAQDTIRLDINTLKSAGFDIKIGDKGNNYCYELKLNPIKIMLNKNEMRAISLAKKAMFDFLDFRYIISIYSTFEKIVKLVESEQNVQEILNFGNFLKMDFKLIKELDTHCRFQNEVLIIYDSPRKGQREMSIKCLDLKYSKKSDKLHLWCNSSEYGEVIYLRVEKIKKILKINKFRHGQNIDYKECSYQILRRDNSPFEVENYEKITKITPKYIQIKARYLNEFNLLQRLLSLGDDLISIDSKQILELLRSKINEIRSVYN